MAKGKNPKKQPVKGKGKKSGGKKKSDQSQEATLRAKLADMTPFRLKKYAKTAGDLSQELINEAADDEALIELIIAAEMGRDLPEPSGTPDNEDDDDDEGDGDEGGDDGDGDDGDGDGEDDGKDGDDGGEDDEDDEEDDEEEVAPRKAPVRGSEEDLLQALLDQVAIQGRVIDQLAGKVDLLLRFSSLIVRNSYKAFLMADKAFGRIFKQQKLKGMDKVRAAVESGEKSILEAMEALSKKFLVDEEEGDDE